MPIIILGDTETTGLKPVEKHKVLEIGLLAVEVPSFQEVASFSTPIRWAKHVVLEDITDDFVLQMHTKNGLLSEIFNEPLPHNNRANGGLPSIWEADAEAAEFVKKWTAGNAPAWRDLPELCGAGPEFDRQYLEKHMPKLFSCFHYRNFDINAFWLLKKYMGEWDGNKDNQPHRAILDCRRELQAIIDFFAWIGQALKEAP